MRGYEEVFTEPSAQILLVAPSKVGRKSHILFQSLRICCSLILIVGSVVPVHASAKVLSFVVFLFEILRFGDEAVRIQKSFSVQFVVEFYARPERSISFHTLVIEVRYQLVGGYILYIDTTFEVDVTLSQAAFVEVSVKMGIVVSAHCINGKSILRLRIDLFHFLKSLDVIVIVVDLRAADLFVKIPANDITIIQNSSVICFRTVEAYSRSHEILDVITVALVSFHKLIAEVHVVGEDVWSDVLVIFQVHCMFSFYDTLNIGIIDLNDICRVSAGKIQVQALIIVSFQTQGYVEFVLQFLNNLIRPPLFGVRRTHVDTANGNLHMFGQVTVCCCFVCCRTGAKTCYHRKCTYHSYHFLHFHSLPPFHDRVLLPSAL